MAVVYSKVLLFDPPLIYTAPDICVFGAVKVIVTLGELNKTLLSILNVYQNKPENLFTQK